MLNNFTPSKSLSLIERVCFAGSLLLFLAAAVLGITTNWIRGYLEAESDEMARLINPEYWSGPALTGSLRVAEAEVKILKGARSQNELKAAALKWSMAAEVAAIFLLALAVALILFGG